MKTLINADTNLPTTATLVADGAIADADLGGLLSGDIADGAAISDADLAVIIAYQKGLGANDSFVALRLTTTPSEAYSFFQINTNYHSPRQTEIISSLIAGFDSDAATATITALAYGQGSGYDVRQLEYEAYGYGHMDSNRQHAVTGLAKNDVGYEAAVASNYDVISIKAVNNARSGFQPSNTDVEVVIATPTGITKSNTVLDAAQTIGTLGVDNVPQPDAGADIANTIGTNGDAVAAAATRSFATSTILWTITDAPAASVAALTDATVEDVAVTGLTEAGTYTLTMTETYQGKSGYDTVDIVISA